MKLLECHFTCKTDCGLPIFIAAGLFFVRKRRTGGALFDIGRKIMYHGCEEIRKVYKNKKTATDNNVCAFRRKEWS